MKKSDLRSGMVVELRNGARYLLADFKGKLHGIGQEGRIDAEGYREDLTYYLSGTDIVKIWGSYPRSFEAIRELTDEEAVWIREETREITPEEAFRILKEHYGCPVKIIDEV